jgi:hypothetical protein
MEANSSNNPPYVEARVPPAISPGQEKGCGWFAPSVRPKKISVDLSNQW